MMEPSQAAHVVGTVVTSETPFMADGPDTDEYWFPDAENRLHYAGMAAAVPRTTFCGRLGECRYYDMDRAIGRSIVLAKALLR